MIQGKLLIVPHGQALQPRQRAVLSPEPPRHGQLSVAIRTVAQATVMDVMLAGIFRLLLITHQQNRPNTPLMNIMVFL